MRTAKLEQPGIEKQTVPQMVREAEAALHQLVATDPDYDQYAGDDTFRQALLAEVRQQDGTDVFKLLEEQARVVDEEIAECKAELDVHRLELETLWTQNDDDQFEYELSSVFIHLGAAGYGHYYLYQRALPHQPDRWLKFNDQTVTDVDASEVFADTTGQTANPYWLSYVRKTDIATTVDAVHRSF